MTEKRGEKEDDEKQNYQDERQKAKYIISYI